MKVHILRLVFMILFGTKICYSQTIVKMQNGYGLVSSRDEMLIQDCQSIEKVSVKKENAFIIKKDNRFAVHVSPENSYTGGYYMYGAIQSAYKANPAANDWSKINFEYDTIIPIESRNPEIGFVVRKGNLYGAINLLSEVTLPIQYDTIFSTKESVCLTLVEKDGKFAIVPDNMSGGFPSTLLNFSYDGVSVKKDQPNIVGLRKDNRYAIAYFGKNRETVISPPIFDSVISYDLAFIKALKGDSTFFLYAQKSSNENSAYSTVDFSSNTFFYNLYSNKQFAVDLRPGKYKAHVFYPYAYLIDEYSAVSIINLEKSEVISLRNETDIKWISVDGNYYSWEYLQFALQNKVGEDYTNVTTLYTMNHYQKVFSYPLDPRSETLRLELYEKNEKYVKVSLENLSNHKTKTLGYIFYNADKATFSQQKPYSE